MESKRTIGIDLAGMCKNPTGLAMLEGKAVNTKLIYTDKEIWESITRNQPSLIAIDAPLSLPRKGESFRKADREMGKKGYYVFPPSLPSMKMLALRAIELNRLIEENAYKTIEVHPTSTRKALQMPLKDWRAIQEDLKTLSLRGKIQQLPLSAHEIDAVTAALTATLHLAKQTEQVGDEGACITVPQKRNWRTLIV